MQSKDRSQNQIYIPQMHVNSMKIFCKYLETFQILKILHVS
jgi:hypothetical protein